MARVGLIRARRVRVGRIKGYIGARDGCEAKADGCEGRQARY